VTFFEGLVILSEMLRFFVFSFLYLKIRFLSMNLFFVSIEGLFVFCDFLHSGFLVVGESPSECLAKKNVNFAFYVSRMFSPIKIKVVKYQPFFYTHPFQFGNKIETLFIL